MKSAGKITLLIAVFLFAVVLTGIFLLNREAVSYEGTIHAAVDSRVIIQRANNGIPLIRASTLNDAYFSVGYLHCQDRQPLIEYFRALATGRLSELSGTDGIFMDRLSLIIGFERKAADIISELEAPYYDYIASYVKGINTFREINGTDSLSRSLLRDWTVSDVVSILLLFDWSDSFQNNKELIFPVHSSADPALKTIIPRDLWFQFKPDEKASVNLLIKIKEEIRKHVGLYQSGFAFYLDDKDLKDGKAVSGFTIDSGLDIFPKWYPIRLIIENCKIDCISASGLPFLLYGRNKQISFSGFNLRMDVQNFRVEKVRKFNDIEKYYRNGKWYNFKTVGRKIYSSYAEDIDEYMDITVRSTDNGPLISDIADNGNNNILCISINSVFPDRSYIKSLFDLPFAASLSDAYNAVRSVASVPKIYLFGSMDDALCAYSGKVPRYIEKEIFNSYNAPILKDTDDISGYSKCYKNRNIIIGNNIYSGLPLLISQKGINIEDTRCFRLRELIEKKAPLTPQDIASILKDTHSVTAEKFIPVFSPVLEQFPIPSAKLCSIYFEEWDHKMNPESVAATIFELLLNNLITETISDETGNDFIRTDNYFMLAEKFYDLMSSGNSSLFDDKGTKRTEETRDMIFDSAFIKTLRTLNKQFGPVMENWRWGRIHRKKSVIPLISDTVFKNKYKGRDETEFPGGNNTVLMGSADAAGFLKPVNVSVMSGIFYLDLNLYFLRNSISQSAVPSSEFFSKTTAAGDFLNIDMSDILYTCTILPGRY
ncbi:MAG: penicillin acylase family protein [Spirochaetes bacterium]|nr:penicillin acylase family protein [Spirochaetota bacterium]